MPEVRDEAKTRHEAALTALRQHPSWVELEADVEEKVESVKRLVLADVFGTKGGRPIAERDQIYLRGFVWGMRWIIGSPRTAERSLERFLREQGIRTKEETPPDGR